MSIPKPTAIKLDRTLKIRMTAEWMTSLQDAAESEHLDLATWARSSLLCLARDGYVESYKTRERRLDRRIASLPIMSDLRVWHGGIIVVTNELRTAMENCRLAPPRGDWRIDELRVGDGKKAKIYMGTLKWPSTLPANTPIAVTATYVGTNKRGATLTCAITGEVVRG